MGLRSGEYEGRYKSSHPRSSMSSFTFLGLCGPVRSKVVHNHDLTGLQGGSQQALGVGLEHSGGGPLHGHGWSHPSGMEARKQRGVLAAVPRDFEEGSLAHGRVGIQGS